MFLAIDPNGDIYPCQRFCGKKAYAIGNVLSIPSLDDLSRPPVARKFIQCQAVVNQKCGHCEHYNYCKGGCTYNAWAAGSDIDPYCEAYKKIFGKIKKGLLKEMESEENIRAITEEPDTGRNQNPLLRKGGLIELSRKNSHPMKTAQNAIKIISYVELAAHPTIEKAVESINRMGLKLTPAYLLKTKESLAKSNQNLNNLYLHLTFRCQLNCSHCYATAGRENRLFMPVKDIVTLVEEASKQGFRQAILTGAEPLLHPDLDHLLQKLAKMKQEVSPMHLVLRSNFVARQTKAELEKLARAFTKIIVSLDGTQEQHDERRGNGAYDATVKNLKRYQEACLVIPNAAALSLGCVFSSQEMKGVQGQSVRELARELDIRDVRFRPVLPIGRALNLEISPASEAISSFYNLDDILSREQPPVHSCGIGQNLYVEPNGSAFPCYAYQETHSYMGNVLDEGLKTVLGSEKFRDLRKHTVDTNPKCSQCKYRYLCGGACRAWGREKNQKNLDEPPPECSRLFRQAEEINNAALSYLASNG